MEITVNKSSFSMKKLFLIWCGIGITSFGGGAITQFLIQDKFIYKYRWITEKEYTTIIGIGQLTPGINILAYTILIGRKLAGWRGSVLSVLGLILPSAAITIALSTVYLSISQYPVVQRSLRAAFASIFGISLVTNWRNMNPILQRGLRKGPLPFFLFLVIIAGTAVLYLFFDFPVILLYLLGSTAGIFIYTVVIKKNSGASK